ncbi:unnamed protein product [Linum trigynum]|uniref:Uncharacterized protein n=1 Tax=Linum trigynum TaxID=586398 RepID=A0AAV2F0X2_9ROSI
MTMVRNDNDIINRGASIPLETTMTEVDGSGNDDGSSATIYGRSGDLILDGGKDFTVELRMEQRRRRYDLKSEAGVDIGCSFHNDRD